MTDPTTAIIQARNAESDTLRAEVDRLSKALVATYTDIEVYKAGRDATFVEGYDQAVREIRDHFKKARQVEIAAEIESIWLKEQLP